MKPAAASWSSRNSRPTRRNASPQASCRERHRHVAMDVLHHVAALIIEAKRPWRSLVPDSVQVTQERMHCRGPRTPRPTHRVANTDHTTAHVAALERHLHWAPGRHVPNRTVRPPVRDACSRCADRSAAR